ncbi:MAG: carboxymuconolactone decarboxylase family protein [Acidimicrobiales bacterium]
MRLPFITGDDLTPDQQEVWDNVTNGRRGDASGLVNDEGGLIGPFNAPLHAPGTGKRVVGLGEALRFETEIDNRLLELAVCTVGAHWRSDFEWFAHSRLAIRAGVTEEAVAAIERGEDPPLERDDERAVYALTRGLMTDGRVPDDVYQAAQGHVGDRGMVELVQLIGYYCLISLTLNTFQIALPPGNEPIWPFEDQ